MRMRLLTTGQTEKQALRRQERFRPARDVLGPEHPLARAANLVQMFERQAGVVLAVILLSAVATGVGMRHALIVLSAALAVGFILAGALGLARQTRSERAWQVIMSGGAGLRVAEVARECERLSDAKRRADLAARLERALDAAERWYQIPVTCRPPDGVRVLRQFGPQVRPIVQNLRSGQADVRGIALLAGFLVGGYGSPLYAGDAEGVRRELVRVAYLLHCRPTNGAD
jgi:hypothetical protein